MVCFEALHRETPGDVLHRAIRDQALVDGIVFGHVGDCDTQHVVDIARHSGGFHDFRHGADPEAEPFQPFRRIRSTGMRSQTPP